MEYKALQERIEKEQIRLKSGIRLAEYLRDMNEHGNGLLICNLADSRDEYSLTGYLKEHYETEISRGLDILKDLAQATETKIYQGEGSAVLREPTALYRAIDEGVIRSNCAEQEYCASYMSEGYHNRPTLVVSAEDCRMIADIEAGRRQKKTVMLCGQGPVFAEVECGTTVQELLSLFKVEKEWKAIVLGNQCGELLLPKEKDRTVEFSYLFDTVEPIYSDMCMVETMKRAAQMAMEDSCQKCVICREGTWQAAHMLADAVECKGKDTDLKELEDIARIAGIGSMCQFGQRALHPVYQAIKFFPDEFRSHIIDHKCLAGCCVGEQNFQIDPQLCTGCGSCVEACEYDAIDGKAKFIHMIDKKMCEKCGACVDACGEGAVKVGQGLKVPTRLTKVGRFRG
ncbi:MAG: NADH-ubiquinone oxidoreductase-F iron-sulfur binding region domain-containing protein [Eubacteriales bacterium]|nr:NADH-ubiquinone oxidoreductase-F iron-sulfur binding region domain-containing protein [Eubacteriales bacterium]